MTLPDLIILALACYLLTDAMVNRDLPYNIMTRIRVYARWQVFTCMYCSGFWVSIAVYLLWLIEPRLMYPPAIGGAAILAWRYTGGNHA